MLRSLFIHLITPEIDTRSQLVQYVLTNTAVCLGLVIVSASLETLLLGHNFFVSGAVGGLTVLVIAPPNFAIAGYANLKNRYLARQLQAALEEKDLQTQALLIQNQELATARRQLSEIAQTDHMTGLLNRRGFAQALYDRFVRDGDDGSRLAIFIFHLDDLHGVNERFGYEAGDAALRTAAERVRQAIAGRDATAAYFSGADFAVSFSGWTDEEEARGFGEAVRAVLTEPFRQGRADVRMRCYCGMAADRHEFVTPSEMTLAAEKAVASARLHQRGLWLYDGWDETRANAG